MRICNLSNIFTITSYNYGIRLTTYSVQYIGEKLTFKLSLNLDVHIVCGGMADIACVNMRTSMSRSHIAACSVRVILSVSTCHPCHFTNYQWNSFGVKCIEILGHKCWKYKLWLTITSQVYTYVYIHIHTHIYIY